ncbi:MAG: hypothetical protein DMG24_20960 [Acidobacteria bacterium]|nr:MAG: hypothetical protein DMG24_20960 [Acidobacteriota bacterium]
MADDVSNSLYRMAGDPDAPGRLIQSLSAKHAEAMRTSLDQQLRVAQEGLTNWTRGFTQQMNLAETAMNSFRTTSGVMFTGLADGMTRSVSNATAYSKSVGDSVAKALKSTLTAITSEAVIRALYNSGLGFYFLAIQAYDQAAKAFEAAAIFGSIAGAAAGIGSAVSGGGTPGGSRAMGGRAGGSGTGATTTAAASVGAPSGQVTVMVIGEAQAATWLTKVISTGVEQHDLRLVASHTKRSAPAAR